MSIVYLGIIKGVDIKFGNVVNWLPSLAIYNQCQYVVMCGPSFSHAGLQDFLTASATKLQNEFDKVCGFLNTHKLLCEHSVEAVRRVESLRYFAREFCGMSTKSTDTGSYNI